MKILAPLHQDPFSLGWSYARGLEALGHEVTPFNPFVGLEKSSLWRSRIGRRLFEIPLLRRNGRQILQQMLDLGNFDALLVIKADWSLPTLWQAYKAARPKTVLVCYNADDPITTWSRGANRPWVTQAIPCYDLYVTYNQALVAPLQAKGARSVLRLPFAWEPEIHPRQPFDDSADVVFVGNSDAYREDWLTALVEHPVARDWRIKVYGRWHKVKSSALQSKIQNGMRTGPELAKITAGARLSLNILRQQNEGSHNMRTFETPGSGGVLASQFSPEQDAVFPKDKAAVYFTSHQDIAPSLAPYIGDTSRLDAVRAESAARVKKELYVDRAKVLADTIEGLRT